MKNFLFILVSFVSILPQVTMAEVANSEPNAIQDFVNRVQGEDKMVWGRGEMVMVPELLQTFFQDSDCTFDHGSPFNSNISFVQEKHRSGSDGPQGHLVCQTGGGSKAGGQKFVLCTHPSISCKSAIGGIKRDSPTYMVPEGQRCDSVSAREALLNSLSSNPGELNVTTAE